MKVNDTVYFWHSNQIEEAQIFMFGGNNQVLLDWGGTWILKKVNEVKLAEGMSEWEWNQLNI